MEVQNRAQFVSQNNAAASLLTIKRSALPTGRSRKLREREGVQDGLEQREQPPKTRNRVTPDGTNMLELEGQGGMPAKACGSNEGGSIAQYLREIGRVKLLSVEEQANLAARIKNGDEEAREHMIKANLRLVVKVAMDYRNMGVPLEDLISEGNLGLMRAIDRFDPKKGKLSTYGSWLIKQSIRRALANQSKTIRLPVYMVKRVATMRRTALRLQEELGREPTDEELAVELGTTAVRVAKMRMMSIRPASLDTESDRPGSRSYAETISEEESETPYHRIEDKATIGMLTELVKSLGEREKLILRDRFGLNGDRVKTLNEVGNELGLTCERVRQIQNAALSKLRKRLEKLDKIVVGRFTPASSDQSSVDGTNRITSAGDTSAETRRRPSTRTLHRSPRTITWVVANATGV